MRSVGDAFTDRAVPRWLPDEVKRYLAHTERGHTIRSIAREAGCHASTVLRQVRRCERRRDDLLIDLGLTRLGALSPESRPSETPENGTRRMTMSLADTLPDADTLNREAPRILRRLNEPGACLAIASELEKAVVVRETGAGDTIRTAVVERSLAEAMALKDWIASEGGARVLRYRITASGRLALKRFLAEDEARRAGLGAAAQPFADQHRDMSAPGRRGRARYNATESPLLSLARRKDKNGQPFLSPDLVAAGERLREDFELAQIGPRITQNWDRFLTGGARGTFKADASDGGSEAAKSRVSSALADLGPGLGDVVLRCCCFLEGMEAVERRLGWSARSGKIVFRIALARLKRHYDESAGKWSPMIG